MKRYKLKFWRMKRGLTQARLGDRLGISGGHYKAIENGVYDPSAKILRRFSVEFDMLEPEVAELFKKEDHD